MRLMNEKKIRVNYFLDYNQINVFDNYLHKYLIIN
jgi:hypothetical protein